MRILIDRCLERYAVTHATSMVPQSVKWGPHRFELPVAQRRYDSPREDEVFVREELPYLVSLCRTAKDGRLEFCTSSELQMEAFRQLISKQGYLGIDWFSDVKLTRVPCPVDRFASWNKVIDALLISARTNNLHSSAPLRIFDSCIYETLWEMRNWLTLSTSGRRRKHVWMSS